MQRAAEYGGEMRRAEPAEKTARFDSAFAKTLSPACSRVFLSPSSSKTTRGRPSQRRPSSGRPYDVDEPASVGPGSCPLSWAIAQHRAIIHQARTGLPTAAGVTSSCHDVELVVVKLRFGRSEVLDRHIETGFPSDGCRPLGTFLFGQAGEGAEFLFERPVLARLLQKSLSIARSCALLSIEGFRLDCKRHDFGRLRPASFFYLKKQ